MSVRMEDIAKILGVSKSTVSRALNNNPLVNENTKKKVLTVAKRLNFRKNYLARSLITKRTNTIGIVLPNILSSYMHEIVYGVETVANKKGYALILCISSDDPKKEEKEIHLLREKQVDGMIIFFIGESKHCDCIWELKQDKIPFVLIDRYLKNIYSDFVVTDNIAGAYMAVKHLIKLGHLNPEM